MRPQEDKTSNPEIVWALPYALIHINQAANIKIQGGLMRTVPVE